MQRQRINHIRWVAGEMGGGVGGGGAGTIAHLWLAGPSWLAWCAVTVTDVQAAQAAYRLATATHLYRAGNPPLPLSPPCLPGLDGNARRRRAMWLITKLCFDSQLRTTWAA